MLFISESMLFYPLGKKRSQNSFKKASKPSKVELFSSNKKVLGPFHGICNSDPPIALFGITFKGEKNGPTLQSGTVSKTAPAWSYYPFWLHFSSQRSILDISLPQLPINSFYVYSSCCLPLKWFFIRERSLFTAGGGVVQISKSHELKICPPSELACYVFYLRQGVGWCKFQNRVN